MQGNRGGEEGLRPERDCLQLFGGRSDRCGKVWEVEAGGGGGGEGEAGGGRRGGRRGGFQGEEGGRRVVGRRYPVVSSIGQF